jgi:hypothetical protein
MNLIEPTQYRIEELFIETKGGRINLENMFEELNLFDSLFLPVVSGNILIVDSVQLSNRLSLDGSEVIGMSLSKGLLTGFAPFKKSYRIYKQTDRRNRNQTSETYILHFVSDELIYSEQQKINQSYETTYSTVVDKIMTQYLKIPTKNRGIFQPSYGVRKIVIPNLSPLDAIEWCSKRALGIKNSPEFLFFCSSEGYNFVPLSTLLTKNPIINISFTPKNLNDNDEFYELSRARSFEVLSQYDLLDRIQDGVNANKLLVFDPITKTFGSQELSFDQIYKLIEHANKNPIDTEIFNRDKQTTTKTTFDSHQGLSIFNQNRGKSNYIKESDPTSISKNEPYELFMTQRKALISNLMTRRLKITMPGNFQLTSGKNINFDTAGFGARSKGQEGKEDESVSGKYIITGTRHILSLARHITIIEVASDSSDKKTFVSNSDQTKVAFDYSKPFATATM